MPHRLHAPVAGMAALLLLVLLGLMGCAARRKDVTRLPEWQEQVRLGDQAFGRMYWQAWKEAQDHYERAAAMGTTRDLDRRRFETAAILFVRETELGAPPDMSLLARARESAGPGPGTFEARCLEGLESLVPGAPFPSSLVLQAPEDSPVRLYLAHFLTQRYNLLKPEELQAMKAREEAIRARLAGAPLFCLMDFGNARAEEFASAIARYPDCGELRRLRAEWGADPTWLYQALEDLDLGLPHLPPSSRIFTLHGDMLLRAERFAEARQAYEKALTLKDDENFALYGRARCMEAQEQEKEAMAAYESMIARQIVFGGEVSWRLGRLYWKAGRPAEALAAADAALVLDGTSAPFNLLKGWLELERNHVQEAGEAFRRAVASDPKSGEAQDGLGCALLRLGRPAEGSACLALAAQAYAGEIEGWRKRLADLSSMPWPPPTLEKRKAALRIQIHSSLGQRRSRLLGFTQAVTGTPAESICLQADTRIRNFLEFLP